MSDTVPIPQDPAENAQQPPGKPGLFEDRMVRLMVYSALALVILFLATVIGVMVSGVTETTGPRSVAEREVMAAAAQVAGTTGDASAPYVTALIAAGNLPAARVALSQARSGVPADASTPDLDLAEARLLNSDKKYAAAITFADKAMKGFRAEKDALVAKEKDNDAAGRIALNEDYYNAALVKAYSLIELRNPKDAVAAFDIYIQRNPTASDIYIDRGNAKADLNDKSGAEKDFRAALRFVPYDAEAKAGLKRIGVSQ